MGRGSDRTAARAGVVLVVLIILVVLVRCHGHFGRPASPC